MKKLAKRPRTSGRTKAKPYPQKKPYPQNRLLNEDTVNFFDELSPGFAAWYRRNYDENGKYVGESEL